MDLKDIKAIIDLMKKNSIAEFELERQDFKIKLKRGGNGVVSTAQYEEPQMVAYAPTPAALTLPGAALAPAPVQSSSEMEIKSPMIGTFYRAPSPEAANYIEVGMEVNPDTVVCIIEAMKVMNEIKAEMKGEIVKVLAANGEAVEYGEPLFHVKIA